MWFDSDNGDEDTCRAELLLPDRRILEVEWLLHDADEDEGGDDQLISGSSENDYYKDYIIWLIVTTMNHHMFFKIARLGKRHATLGTVV